MDATLTLPDGSKIGYADYGDPNGIPVLWCHGGPGSRLEPAAAADDAPGFRFIGIDRPGYGNSTAIPGRTIAQWVPHALAVLDALNIKRCIDLGVSTGGAYALALAANAPDRVIGVVACCALTDMRWAEGKAMMEGSTGAIWNSKTRAEAIAHAEGQFGTDGTKMFEQAGPGALAPSDLSMLADPAFMEGYLKSVPVMFGAGVGGYVDDRLADGPGWGSFDVAKVQCPVVVLHGEADMICPVAFAHHTAKITPNAELSTHADLGHFSIMTKLPEAFARIRARANV